MTASTRISYVIMAVLFALVGWLHMGTLLLTVLFGYFALNYLSFGKSKVLGVTVYLILVATITWGVIYFSKQTYKALPKIGRASCRERVYSSV